MTNDTKLAIGLIGFFASLTLLFWSFGYFARTSSAPLVTLSLNQTGCEYLSRSGITTEVKNGICMITVRYRAYRLTEGGYLERPGLQPLAISCGQVVGVVKLDDGSDEPWTAEHKTAAICLAVAMLLMAVFLWLTSLGAKQGKRKIS